MTFSFFDNTGNLVDAFEDQGAALDCLAVIAHAEPESASEIYLAAQVDDGRIVGDLICASSVSDRA